MKGKLSWRGGGGGGGWVGNEVGPLLDDRPS